MEAVPRMPMLAFDVRVNTDPVDFSSVLKPYISTHYQEDADSYNKECTELEQLRNSAIFMSRDFTGCSTLKKYYSQLHFLQSRFPMKEDGDAAISFTWEEPYRDKILSYADIGFEQSCILYNIGALHSILGAVDNRQSAEGMKISCTHFQCAAWAFQQLRDNYHNYGYEKLYELVSAKISLMLAQAQECILEKSMTDNRKYTITAKVAAQIVDYYQQATKNLETNGISDIITSRRLKEWKHGIDLKINYYQCVTYLYQSMEREAQERWGERLAYCRVALDHLNTCIKLSKNESTEVEDALKFTMDVVGGKFNAAKKDNDFVYHEKEPEIDTLDVVKGAALVKGIPFDITDREVSGLDIFRRLVPMEAHQASSVYSEEKAKLLRHIGSKVDGADHALNQFLDSIEVDLEKLSDKPESLPSNLLEKCAAISVKRDAITDLIEAMQELSSVATDMESNISEIKTLGKADKQYEAEFQKQVMRRAYPTQVVDLLKECSKYEEGMLKAQQSNVELHQAMQTHIANLKLLAGPLNELEAALPAVNLTKLSDEDKSVLSEMHRLMNKVEEMSIQRQNLHKQLREQVQKDDITDILVTQEDTDQKAFFDKQLLKHKDLESFLEQNISAQDNILKALTDCNAKYANIKNSQQQTQEWRSSMISSLIQSYDVYEDLLAKTNKGTEFYRKLEGNVLRLLDRVKGVCKLQQEERQHLKDRQPKPTTTALPPVSVPAVSLPGVSDSITDYIPSSSLPATSLPSIATSTGGDVNVGDVKPAGLTLKDYLPYMKPQTFGKSTTTWSKGKTPTNVADLYAAYGGISGLSDVPSISGSVPGGIVARSTPAAAYPGASVAPYPGSLPTSHTASPVHLPAQPSSQPASPARLPPVPNNPSAYSTEPPLPAGYTPVVPDPRPMPKQNIRPTPVPHRPPVPRPTGQPAGYGPQTHPPASYPGGAPVPYLPQAVTSTGYQVPPRNQTPAMSSVPRQGYIPVPAVSVTQGYIPTTMIPSSHVQPHMPQTTPYPSQNVMLPPNQRPSQPQADVMPSNICAPGSLPPNTPPQVYQPIQAIPHQPTQAAAQQPIHNSIHQPTQVMAQQPSHIPVQPPIQAPMHQPSQASAQQPTQVPTQQPNHAPAQQPIQPPVHQPSQAPAQQPIQTPMYQPSQAPVQQPSQVPTHHPSSAPAQQPIQAPIHQPSQTFGQRSTQPPYEQPSQAPVQLPTQSTAQAHPHPGQIASSVHGCIYPPQTPQNAMTGNPPVSSLPNQILSTPQSNFNQTSTHPQLQPHNTGQNTNLSTANVQPYAAHPTPSTLAQPSQPNTVQPLQATTVPPPHPVTQPMPTSRLPNAGVTLAEPTQQQRYQTPGIAPSIQPIPHPPNQQSVLSSTIPSVFSKHPYSMSPASTTQPAFSGQQVLPTQPSVVQNTPMPTQPSYPASNMGSTMTVVSSQPGTNVTQNLPQQQYSSGSTTQAHSREQHHHTMATSAGMQDIRPSSYSSTQPVAYQNNLNKQTAYPAYTTSMPGTQPPAAAPGQYTTSQPTSQAAYPGGNQPAMHSQNVVQPRQQAGQYPSQVGYLTSEQPTMQSTQPVRHTTHPIGNQSYQNTQPSSTTYQPQGQNYQPASTPGYAHNHHQNIPTPAKAGPLDPPPANLIAPLQPTTANIQTTVKATNSNNTTPIQTPNDTPTHVPSHTDSSIGGAVESVQLPLSSVGPPPPTQPTTPSHQSNSLSRQCSSISSSLDDILSIADEPTQNGVLKPHVVTDEEKQLSKDEKIKKSLRHAKMNPYCDDGFLQRFVQEVERFEKTVEGLNKHTLSGHMPLEKDWKELMEDQEKLTSKSMAIARCYPMKNRDQHLMPYDSTRVILKEGKDDYINATHIGDLATYCPKFIVSQAPMPTTIEDFWLMTLEQGTEIIVELCTEQEPIQPKIVSYFPEERGRKVVFGNFVLELQTMKEKPAWIERIVHISHSLTHQTRTIVHLQFLHWPPSGVPLSPGQLLQFINEVHYFYTQQRNLVKPVIVHCSNGVGRSGAFCVIYTGMQQIEYGDGLLDINALVTKLRTKRKHMITEIEQLRFCYHAILYHAQDLLMKRGILTNRASFSDKLPGQSTSKGHQRKPSEDFILGNVASLSTIQNSVDKMSVTRTSVQTHHTVDTNDNGVTPAKNDHGMAEMSMNTDVEIQNDKNNSELMCTDVNVNTVENHNVNLVDPAMALDTVAPPAAADIAVPHQVADSVAPSLASLQDPQTFTLGSGSNSNSPKSGRKITKQSFLSGVTGINNPSLKDSADPLDDLDPLWSVGQKK